MFINMMFVSSREQFRRGSHPEGTHPRVRAYVMASMPRKCLSAPGGNRDSFRRSIDGECIMRI